MFYSTGASRNVAGRELVGCSIFRGWIIVLGMFLFNNRTGKSYEIKFRNAGVKSRNIGSFHTLSGAQRFVVGTGAVSYVPFRS